MTTATVPYTAAPAKPPGGSTPPLLRRPPSIALFIGMRFWRMTDFTLDGDEIFSVQLARDN